jgi:hypothetical protein
LLLGTLEAPIFSAGKELDALPEMPAPVSIAALVSVTRSPFREISARVNVEMAVEVRLPAD